MTEQVNTHAKRKRYKTDLTDAQWELLRDLIPRQCPRRGVREPRR